MQHSHATKAGGRRYRYYVSKPLLNRNPGIPGSIPRVPAQAIEDLVRERVQALLPASLRNDWDKMTPGDRTDNLRRALQRVELRVEEVEMTLSKGALDPKVLRVHQASAQRDQIFEKGDSLILRIPIRLKTWGGEKLIHVPSDGISDRKSRPDRALIKAMAKAHEWREDLEKGEIESASDLARRAGCTYHYVKRILKLSYLAPDIVDKILQGRQPAGVNLSHILRVNLPLSWKTQRELLGFFADSPA